MDRDDITVITEIARITLDIQYIDPFGNCYYRKDKKLHREEGPAIIRGNINKDDLFYIHGRSLSKEDWRNWIKKHSKLPLNIITKALLENI
jgi:hypothetical protein